MRGYLVGVDGGGTKTTAVLVNQFGRFICSLTTGGTNHQIVGIKEAVSNLSTLLNTLLQNNGLSATDVDYLMMGLAGADFQEDIDAWENALPEEITSIPHNICTDTWVALAAGTPKRCGAISICGTGHNTAVKSFDGAEYSISALKFALGNFGGGRMITDFAMHAAFRDYEHIGRKTLLSQRLPDVCQAADMDDLREKVLRSAYTYQYNYQVPKLVSLLAKNGDAVSEEILQLVGKTQGEMTGRLLHHAGLEKSEIPVVLAGSVYCGDSDNEVVRSYQKELEILCPEAKIDFILLKYPPVIGSLVLAFQNANKSVLETDLQLFYDNLISSFRGDSTI